MEAPAPGRARNAGRKEPNPHRPHEYVSLPDAMSCTGLRVNFYGIVANMTPPSQTEGQDMMCSFTLMDMSPIKHPGLEVVVFAKDKEMLPKIQAVGDIIRCHRVLMQIYRDAPQAVAQMHRGCSFCVFHRIPLSMSDPFEPYYSSSPRYTMGDADSTRIQELREWAAEHPVDIGQMRPSAPLLKLSELRDKVTFDLRCKLIYAENPGAVNIKFHVWDGTDALASPIQPRTALVNWSTILSTIVSGSTGGPPREALRDSPKLGTILPVIVKNPPLELARRPPVLGTWLLFQNLLCQKTNTTLEAVFLRHSKVTLLENDCPHVKDIERAYCERWISEATTLAKRVFTLKSPTVIDHEGVPYSTLREVLCHEQVTYNFRCLVQVVDVFPPKVENLCEETAKLQATDQSSLGSHMYRMCFTLQDATGTLYASLSKKEAVEFFGGVPAKEFHTDSAAFEAVRRKMEVILGGGMDGSQPREPPWIKCCLNSFYRDKSRQWETRSFRIFGTRFVS